MGVRTAPLFVNPPLDPSECLPAYASVIVTVQGDGGGGFVLWRSDPGLVSWPLEFIIRAKMDERRSE